MRNDTKLIVGGKETTHQVEESLIKQSAEKSYVILTANSAVSNGIKEYANELGIEIPEPMTISEFRKNPQGIRGVLVYDLDLIIDSLLHGLYAGGSVSKPFMRDIEFRIESSEIIPTENRIFIEK